VQAAVNALDGRGGTEALRRLQLLLADPMQGIRAAAVRALAKYGSGGLALVEGALRDADGEVRLAALEALAAARHEPALAAACALLVDEDPRVAVAAARGLAPRAAGCDLAPLGVALAAADDEADARRLVGVLGVLGGTAAVALLEGDQQRRKPASPGFWLAARVRAGDLREALTREVEAALARCLDDAERLLVSWPGEKLGPGAELAVPARLPGDGDGDEGEGEGEAEKPAGQGEPAGSARPDVPPRPTTLGDQELEALYKKHKLGDVRAASPRGITDLLGAFPEQEGRPPDGRLFPPVTDADLADLALLVEALATLAPSKVAPAAERVVALGQRGATAALARALLGAAEAFQPSEAGLAALARTLAEADAAEAAPIAQLVARARQKAGLRVLTAALEPAGWEKREALIEALGRMGDREAVGALTGMLKGYSAIAAARALAELGDPEAAAPLRQALGQAGPVEEMEILMALARLGDRGELARLLERLDSPDADMRRAALRVLGAIGTPEAREAAKGLRYDLDRLVREEVQLITEGVSPPASGGGRSTGDTRDGEHP